MVAKQARTHRTVQETQNKASLAKTKKVDKQKMSLKKKNSFIRKLDEFADYVDLNLLSLKKPEEGEVDKQERAGTIALFSYLMSYRLQE